MAYSTEQWDVVRAFYESGLSLSEIAARPEVKITDRGSVSRKAKAEGWIKGKIQHIIDGEVQNKQELAEIVSEKATLNATVVKVADTLVDERTKHIQFFNNAAITNVRQAMDEPCEGQNDYRARADTIAKGREVVLGKAPETAIQINNNGEFKVIERTIVHPAN